MLPLLSSAFSSADSVLWFVDTFMTLFCWKCLETNQNEGVLLKQKHASRLYIARRHGALSIQQKFRFEISEISGAQWSCTFRLDRPDPSHRAFGYCSCKQDTKERHWTTILSNGKGHFGPTDRNDQTGQSGPSSKLVPNIPVGPNGNGPFHLVYQPKFPELWVEWKAPMNWGPVHKDPFLFENRFFSPIWSTAHTYPVKTVTENGSFKNAPQSEDFRKRRLFVYVWKDEDGGFRILWRRAKTIPKDA